MTTTALHALAAKFTHYALQMLLSEHPLSNRNESYHVDVQCGPKR